MLLEVLHELPSLVHVGDRCINEKRPGVRAVLQIPLQQFLV